MESLLKISVVIPTCNRPAGLEACLSRLAPGRQQLSTDHYEVIITNDGSDAGLDTIARKFPWAKIIEGPKRGPAANRNCGARKASGEWIAFIDDDCIPSDAWLSEIHAAARTAAYDLLEGRVDAFGSTGHPFDELIQNHHGNAFWSCNLAVRRSIFEVSGGFDEDFKEAAFEDMEFAARLKKFGARTAFLNAARVEHPTRRLTLSKLWKRKMMYRWYTLYLRKTSSFGSMEVAWLMLTNLGRNLRNHLREFDVRHWQRSLFLPLWEVVTFPVVFPCVVFWDWEFRRAPAK